MTILIDLTIHSNRIELGKTIKEECVADVAIFSSHNLRSTKIGKLQKNTEFKREIIKNNMVTDNGL